MNLTLQNNKSPDYDEALRAMIEQYMAQQPQQQQMTAPPPQQNQQQQGMNPLQMMQQGKSIYSMIAGSGAGAMPTSGAGTGMGAGFSGVGNWTAGAGYSGTAGAGTAAGAEGTAGATGASSGLYSIPVIGWIAAAIAAQHALSTNTNTRFEGVKTGDAFSGHFGTEPWLAFAHDKMGMGPTSGEKFDAAIANRDWGKAAQRMPAMVDYWADPPRTWARDLTEKVAGKTGAWIVDPVGSLLQRLGG